MTSDLSHIRGIVWDLDGTLYRYDHIFIEACNIAAARTAIELGLSVPYDDALSMARRSEREFGNSFKLFERHGIRYEDFHAPYHAAVDLTIIAKNLEMKLALETLRLPMVILTNASRDWARRALDHLGYSSLFTDRHLLALEDVEYHSKAHSTRGFEKALSLLGTEASGTLMVEDLSKNLIKAKEIGMTTALVHHGQRDQETDHADHLFDDTLHLVHALLAG